jgi:hypothetical protein
MLLTIPSGMFFNNRHKSIVKFIDFTEDGYERSNRKKSKYKLKDVDSAKQKYQEVVNLVKFGVSKLKYLKKENYYEGHIDPNNGCDWNQTFIIDEKPKLEDFKKLMKEALAPYPAYMTLVKAKIRGETNAATQKILEEKHDLHHTPEYISSLWRNKIPKIISEKAKDNYLIWYYTEVEVGTWKKCTRCGEVKLAHNRFFSKNNTSKDGFYSICKSCRNSKNKEKK